MLACPQPSHAPAYVQSVKHVRLLANEALCRGYDLRGQPQVELTLEAVIVGVLLFTPLLLLLPTGLVFYALLAGLHLAAALVRSVLAACALLAVRSPIAAMAVRWARPGLFPGKIAPRYTMPGDCLRVGCARC